MSNKELLNLEFAKILSLDVETTHKDNLALNQHIMNWVKFYVQEDHGHRYDDKIKECYSFVPLSQDDIISCRVACRREQISDEKCFNDNKSFSKCIGELKALIDSTNSEDL